MSLFRLVYVSRPKLGTARVRQEAEVERILAASHRNNPAAGLTGALLFSADCFAQTLEGTMDAVEAVFERIQMDDRHSDTVVLHAQPIGVREFGSWSMAYAGHDAGDELRFGALTSMPGLQGQNQVLDMLRRVVLHTAPALQPAQQAAQ